MNYLIAGVSSDVSFQEPWSGEGLRTDLTFMWFRVSQIMHSHSSGRCISFVTKLALERFWCLVVRWEFAMEILVLCQTSKCRVWFVAVGALEAWPFRFDEVWIFGRGFVCDIVCCYIWCPHHVERFFKWWAGRSWWNQTARWSHWIQWTMRIFWFRFYWIGWCWWRCLRQVIQYFCFLRCINRR